MIDQYPPANGVLTSLIWRKTMSGGETSLSGYDNASQALSYTPGQEQVYLNGILLVRGDDYTATNGTSITGLTALAANDFVQVNCYNNFSVATTPATSITGTIANNQLANSSITINGNAVSLGGSVSLPGDIESVTAGTGLTGGGNSGAVTLGLSTPVATTNGGTGLSTFTTGDLVYASGSNTLASRSIGSTGQVLTVSGGVPAWATPTAPAMVFITGASFSAVSSVSLPTNTFTSTYDIYKIFFQFSAASSTSVIQLRMRNSGTDITSSNYFFGGFGTDYFSSTTVYKNGSANSAWTINADANIDRTTWELTFTNPQNSSFGGQGWITGMGDRMAAYSSGLWQNAVGTFDSMSIIKSTSGTISGKYAVYGLVKS